MDDSQVAVHTSQTMKQHLSRHDDNEKVNRLHHPWITIEGTKTEEVASHNSNQLHGDHVVGEDVQVVRGYVGRGSMETQAEDKDAERE